MYARVKFPKIFSRKKVMWPVLFAWMIPVYRKLKKMLQRKKSDLDSKQQEELNKTLHSYEKDNILCPFIGINPEYMEMSESQH